MSTFNNRTPEQGPSSETRQPTGLNRIGDPAAALDLPPEVEVVPVAWDVIDDAGKRGWTVTRGYDGSYMSAGIGMFPTLAEAVAALLRRAES